MTATIRFPRNRTIPNQGAAESDQIITIATNLAALAQGGEQAYTDVRVWRTAGSNDEAPYACVVLEFIARQVTTVGNGIDQMIGLYGEIGNIATPASAADRFRTLIGICGLNLGNTMPQIPIVQQVPAASDFVGFSQVFTNIAAYDRLSIGGVLGDVALDEGVELTVRARPIRRRDYLG